MKASTRRLCLTGLAAVLPTTRDVLPSASDHLPRVGLFEPKDVRDVAVRIVERLSKDERRSFDGGQRFQQHQNSERQRLASFSTHSGAELVSTGSCSHGPTYVSRRERADCMTLIASRVVVVTRNAAASRTTLRSAVCQRTQTSCTMSSASAALPSIR